jgi:regulator of replication initiation timing
MFAVREEVDLLKEKINELTIRNSQLEKENSFLRSLASEETLASLTINVSQP